MIGHIFGAFNFAVGKASGIAGIDGIKKVFGCQLKSFKKGFAFGGGNG